jgi:hypothetical protein
VYEDEHWDSTSTSGTALYVDVRFDALLHPDAEGVLPFAQLTQGRLPFHSLADAVLRHRNRIARGRQA